MRKLIEIDYSSLKSLPELLKLLRAQGVPDSEFWMYVNQYREQKAREKAVPLHGMFELTPLCNLDCKMCYVHLNREQLGEAKLLTVEQWKSIIRQAHEMGMMNATLTGGECLTYPGFDEIYLYLRSLGIRGGIKTNGLLLDQERVAFFEKYQPSSITVSLYGSSNETYKKVTGYEAFDKVYEHLLKLKNVSFPVNLSITPSIYMYEDVPQIVTLARSLGYSFSINIALFSPREETGRVLCDLSIDQYLAMYRMLLDGNVEPREPAQPFDIPKKVKAEKPTFGIPCGAGRSSFNIAWNGTMKGCENLNALKVSALDQPFSVAWAKIHEDAESYPLPTECMDCKYDDVCFGCVAYRSLNTEPGHCNPKICKRTERMVKEGFYRL